MGKVLSNETGGRGQMQSAPTTGAPLAASAAARLERCLDRTAAYLHEQQRSGRAERPSGVGGAGHGRSR